LRQRDDTMVANAKSLRTAGNGWLWFAIPEGLAYKCVHGRMDLYVTSHGFTGTRQDLEAEVARAGGLGDFTEAADTNGALATDHVQAQIKALACGSVVDAIYEPDLEQVIVPPPGGVKATRSPSLGSSSPKPLTPKTMPSCIEDALTALTGEVQLSA
jgi:hypothetical protein